jgi:hypothetical protein
MKGNMLIGQIELHIQRNGDLLLTFADVNQVDLLDEFNKGSYTGLHENAYDYVGALSTMKSYYLKFNEELEHIHKQKARDVTDDPE